MINSRYLKIFFLFCSLSSSDSYAVDQANKQISHSGEAFTVQLDKKLINATDIQTQNIQTTQYSPEIRTFATRVDLSSLIDSRKEYLAALAKQTTAKIIYKKSQQDLQRLKNLQRDKAVSTRKLLAQKSQLKIDKTNYITTGQQADIILLHTRTTWGKVLSHWFLSEEYPYTNMLNTLNKAVYLVYLPTSFSPIKSLSIHPFGLPEKAHTASLISSAPFIKNNQQTGTPFFYLSDQSMDTYHHRVVALLPMQANIQSGFIIPESAIVWHLGQTYVYLKIDDELFKRIKIPQKKLVSSEYFFIQQPLQEGDILVVKGTQMLLSEEFRGQIPAEDDDDDDDD